MFHPRVCLISAILMSTVVSAAVGGSRLSEGGFRALGRGASSPATPPRAAAVAPAVVESLRAAERFLSASAQAERLERPKALGDRMRVSLDDDVLPDALIDGIDIAGQYEARLDVSGGVAGPSDWLAVRFPARDLARGLPVRVHDVVIGFDDLNGATTWPEVEVWLEDPSNPLLPRQGAASVAASPLDVVAAGLAPAPPGALDPSRFARLAVGLPGGLDLPADWLGDGAFDDAYERFDQPLDDLAGLWLECEGDQCCQAGGCGFTRTFLVRGNRVVRGAGSLGTSIAVRFSDPVVEAVRPAVDLDLRVSAMVDLSDPLAGPAGLFMRALSTDSYYAVLIDPGPSPDELVAIVVTPGGSLELGREALTGDGGQRSLAVEVTGVNPQVDLAVEVDGGAHGPFSDSVYRWAGSFAGLVAGGAGSQGEAWDEFQVQRRRDVFVTLRLPAGEDVGLPLDVSTSSVAWRSILTSSDGSAWLPRPSFDPAFCFNPGNPFVQLEVEETTLQSLLFESEARLVTLDLDCPTCPPTRNRCNENGAAAERFAPLPTVGEALSVRVGWWNEHLGSDRLLLRTSIVEGDCDAAGAVLATTTAVAGDTAGQGGGAGAAVGSRGGLLDFTPLLEGTYCVVVEEFHDTNADCCADGLESSGVFDDPFGLGACPGACSPAAGSDSNPSTAVLVRDFQVFAACTPGVSASDMDGGSLRLAKTGGSDPLLTDLLLLDDTRTVYNVHAMPGRPFDTSLCFEEYAPIVDRLVFSGPVGNEVRRTYAWPAPAEGRVLWLAAFETDGCPAAGSLPDDAADDPALGTCLP